MNNKKLKEKTKTKEKKNYSFRIILSIAIFIIVVPFSVVLITFFVPKEPKEETKQTFQTSYLYNKFQDEVTKNLLSFIKKKKFISIFDTIYDLSDWLSESGETDFGKEIRELQPIRNLIKNKTFTISNSKEKEKKLKQNLMNYKNIYKTNKFSNNNKHKFFNNFINTFPTEKERKNAFIESFKNLFIFCLLREQWGMLYFDNKQNKENEDLLFYHNNIAFSSLNEQSQELMWKNFSMNIITLLTPTSQKQIEKISSFSFSLPTEKKIFLEMVEKKFLSFYVREERKTYIQNYNNKISEKNKNYKTYKVKFNETTIIEDSLTREQAKRDFVAVFLDLHIFCLLENKTTNNFELASFLKQKNKDSLIKCSKFLFLLSPEECKENFWDSFSS